MEMEEKGRRKIGRETGREKRRGRGRERRERRGRLWRAGWRNYRGSNC